ncbi:monosaccharide ABC transporter membrane protein (CUT2 family) [Frigoribacterium sp. PhB160]|uniref:ABC transporter permease n=1 Tax=Frigoribacterium sp. PhB160 TaxID=2485192 RepID=UPI000F4A6E9B|nr:ABC transporter permease [Frigoribacterium sp. PhB160]ROS61275.1 monosaccharide ABC transporter membrane protein (CUT2 family) [Frigoribacterium sp. PhB160]
MTTTLDPTTAPTRPGGAPRDGAVGRVRDTFRRNTTLVNIVGLLVAIVLLYLYLMFNAVGFFTVANQSGLLRDAALIGIAATGMTLVIIAGEIDVSTGPAVALSSVIVAVAMTQWGLPALLAILLTLVVGAGWGALAGVLRARFLVPSFIATLGLWSVLRGLGQFGTDALPVPLPIDEPVMPFLTGTIVGVPTPAVVMIVAFLVFAFVARKTAFGRSVFAIGGNAAAARLAGIKVARVRIVLFAIMGMLGALSGVLLAARLGSGNAGAANGLEFDVIAAVVIGGTAMSGGRGSLVGTFLGVIFITLIGNGLVLLGVDSFLQSVVRGVIIVLAVLLNVTLSRKRGSLEEN